jgi:hypothetical protein
LTQIQTFQKRSHFLGLENGRRENIRRQHRAGNIFANTLANIFRSILGSTLGSIPGSILESFLAKILGTILGTIARKALQQTLDLVGGIGNSRTRYRENPGQRIHVGRLSWALCSHERSFAASVLDRTPLQRRSFGR